MLRFRPNSRKRTRVLNILQFIYVNFNNFGAHTNGVNIHQVLTKAGQKKCQQTLERSIENTQLSYRKDVM